MSDPEPSPTCPFIKKLQCQRANPTLEADNFRSPLFLSGDWLSVYVGDLRDGCAYLVSTASVRWHIWATLRFVNTPTQFYFNFLTHPPKISTNHLLYNSFFLNSTPSTIPAHTLSSPSQTPPHPNKTTHSNRFLIQSPQNQRK